LWILDFQAKISNLISKNFIHNPQSKIHNLNFTLKYFAMRQNHEIDYKIFGEELQFVEVELDPGETAIAESGAFMMMDDGIVMQTIFGDGSQQQQQGGILGKLISAGKRVLVGESLFMTAFTNVGQGKKRVSFAAPYTGKIVAIDLLQHGGRVIAQKDAFLCAAKGVSIGIEFQRRLGTGIFGGEGFIMEKLEGDGMAFMHAGGYVMEKELQAGEILKVDTGCIVAYTGNIDFDVELVRGVRNWMFGGEGLFFAILRGPGKVWIQSLPISRLASRIIQYSPQMGHRREEGSILGGLGNLLDGDGR
jgi:uncharacterized protein (TIGR00266 family)